MKVVKFNTHCKHNKKVGTAQEVAEVLEKLRVGEQLQLKYYSTDILTYAERIIAEVAIKHGYSGEAREKYEL